VRLYFDLAFLISRSQLLEFVVKIAPHLSLGGRLAGYSRLSHTTENGQDQAAIRRNRLRGSLGLPITASF
jgi:hypothetical protein